MVGISDLVLNVYIRRVRGLKVDDVILLMVVDYGDGI